MEYKCNTDRFENSVEGYLSMFGYLLDNYFVNKNYKANALITLQKVKDRKIDPKKIESFIRSLPDDIWTAKIIFEKMTKVDELFKITDEDILSSCVDNLKEKDIIKVKWELLKEVMLDYSKYANQFYDAMKYTDLSNLPRAKIMLTDEMMITFRTIKDSSKTIYNKFDNQKYSVKKMRELNNLRMPLEFLWMRILYILFNIQNASENKIREFRKLLSMERSSLDTTKRFAPRFN